MHGGALNFTAVTDVSFYHVVIGAVFRVWQWQVTDHERIFNSDGVCDAMNGTGK